MSSLAAKESLLSSETPLTVEEIKRVSALANPVNRNLQITNCYCELSGLFAKRTGIVANWCTFATWASKQAGVTIRGEDIRRTLEETLRKEPEIQQILSLISLRSKKLGSGEVHENIPETVFGKVIRSATQHAGDAVARGNKKVFEEIGYEFARFIATCPADEVYKESTINDFCKALKPGPPPDGQDYLCKAFTCYYKAFFETDSKKRDELYFLANIEIGFHEQTRLQPEIAESLDAGLVDAKYIKDQVSEILLKSKNIFGKLLYFFNWLTGKRGLLNKAIDSLVAAVEKHTRRIITEHLMMLSLPPDTVLHLGSDLIATYPENLKQLSNADLRELLTQFIPSTDPGSGAADWSILPERLHFIADLFRCYHVNKDLFSPAFSAEQIAIIRSGGIPDGRL